MVINFTEQNFQVQKNVEMDHFSDPRYGEGERWRAVRTSDIAPVDG